MSWSDVDFDPIEAIENAKPYEENINDEQPSQGLDDFLDLDHVWKTFSRPEVAKPPSRSWLVKDSLGKGIVPKGKAVALGAGGGTGKTALVFTLAVAVATGTQWPPVGNATQSEPPFRVPNRGRVLMLLGEEDQDEVLRRLHSVFDVMKLSEKEQIECLQRIVVVPLAGYPIAFVRSLPGGLIEESDFLKAIKTKLDGLDWSLIVIDPLSRFASGDAEKDNAQATRFVQAVESLTRTSGNPTVLVAAHSSQDSLSRGTPNLRGVTGLHDAFRQVLTLKSDGDLVILHQTKSNYSFRWKTPMHLAWQSAEYGAALRMASKEEINEASKKESTKGKPPKGKPPKGKPPKRVWFPDDDDDEAFG